MGHVRYNGSQIGDLIASDEKDLLEGLSDRIQRERLEETSRHAPFQKYVLNRRLGLHRPATLKTGDGKTRSENGSVYGQTQQAVEQLPLLFEAASTQQARRPFQRGVWVVPVALVVHANVRPRNPKALQIAPGGSV